MERDTLDPVYSSFLIKFGGKDVRVIDAIAPMRRGIDIMLFTQHGHLLLMHLNVRLCRVGGRLDRKMFLEWAREQNLPDIMGCIFGLHHNVICDVVHPGTDCVTVVSSSSDRPPKLTIVTKKSAFYPLYL